MQEIIVYLIGGAILVYIGVKIYGMFFRKSDPCYGCAGCALKSELDKKRADCPDRRPKKSKSCCR